MLRASILLVLKLSLVAAASWIVYKLFRLLREHARCNRLARDWGCKPAKRLPVKDPIFGLDAFFEMIMDVKRRSVVQSSHRRFQKANANTFVLRVFLQDIIWTREPENIKTFLSLNFDSYALKPLRKGLEPLLGAGIFTTDGHAWQQSRSMLRPMFTRSQLADLSIFETHVNNFLTKIPLDGSTIDLQPMFFALTLDIASHVFLGESTDCQIPKVVSTEGIKFSDAFNRVITAFGDGSQIEIFGLKLPTPQFDRDCKFIHDFVDSYVERAIERKRNGLLDEKIHSQSRNVFLFELVAETEDVVQIRNEILSTIVAGRDTTASMLSDLWFELSKHPQVFSTLWREVESMSSHKITLELLKSMRYMRAVLNEILRVHPVLPENSRMSMKDTMLPLGGGNDELSPFMVPKGSLVAWSPSVMHRRKDIWGDDADEFKPERWIDTEERKGIRPGWAYLPFNGGPRICIGQQFALAQVSYVTVRMMQMIGSLESRDPNPWREKLGLAVTGDNCRVSITPRK